MSAVSFNFTITDSKGKSSVTKVRTPSGFSVSQYSEFGIAMAQVLTNMSDGVLTDVSIGIPLDLSGATIRAVAAAGADVAKKMLLSATSAVSGLFARFHIPTYDEDHTTTGSDSVDMADAEVAALIAVIEAGSGGVLPVDRRGNDLEDVTQAREVFRKFG